MKVTQPEQIVGVVESGGISLLSIDLFDTLVYRRCSRPDRVFAAQFRSIADLVPEIPGPEAWVDIRKSAELKASEERFPEEVRLVEIYQYISAKMGLPPEVTAQMIQAELDCEAQFIAPFVDVVKVVETLRNRGIKIVINTDIYLPVEFIRTLVDRICGHDVDVLCSSETRHPKRTGAAFALLKSRFPGENILHIGDNPYSDYRMARRRGIRALVVEWDRSRWIQSNVQWTGYLDELRCFQISDAPQQAEKFSFDLACDTVAWRWATVLFDYLVCLRDYARRIAADEIWFLSRDCESIYSAVADNSGFLNGVPTQYVYTSRAATYPLFAASRPETFQSLTARYPSEDDLKQCCDLTAAYRQYVKHGSRSILIVDAGWKGRVQMALQSALPDVKVYGFYFSLDSHAEPEARAASECFVPWRPAHLNQAAVECLLGYREHSCIGYSQDDSGRWIPRFRASNDDLAPSPYSVSLRHYLTALLRNIGNSAVQASVEQRLVMVQQVCLYPDEVTARAFRDWAIGADAAGHDTVNLIGGGSASGFCRVLGIQRQGNLWPALAVWGLTGMPMFARSMQHLICLRKALTFAIRRRLPSLMIRRRKLSASVADQAVLPTRQLQ
jgi:FMN phosphatase YigB (HAD superfamily)